MVDTHTSASASLNALARFGTKRFGSVRHQIQMWVSRRSRTQRKASHASSGSAGVVTISPTTSIVPAIDPSHSPTLASGGGLISASQVGVNAHHLQNGVPALTRDIDKRVDDLHTLDRLTLIEVFRVEDRCAGLCGGGDNHGVPE